MQFDPLDKKIKEAADQHHPAYDEHAWKKMKKMLDQHMPQKEKKRRFLFIIPLFLLLGGGIFYFVSRPGVNNKNGIAAESTERTAVPSQNEPANDSRTIETNTPVTTPAPSDTNRQPEPMGNEENDLQEQETITRTPTSGKSRKAVSPVVVREEQEKNAPLKKVDDSNPKTPESPDKTNIFVQPLAVNPAAEKKDSEEQPRSEENTANESRASETGSKKKPAPNRFFFYVSAGADLSFTKQAGDTRMLAGVGAGFTIRDRITIRSGLFSGRKVYSAGPDEYDPPAIFWAYYPNLEKVDADCKVYELPLLVSYQFGRSSKQAWMATAGISTLFMKEEKYKFYYKPTPTSPTAMRQYTWKNEATHPFSVITISGGYKRNLGKRITVMAEPYLKVPLNGIGYGKVKLNSGGIMVSVGINPF